MKYYAAGGAVRDLLLGQPVRDVDYAFSATEEEFIQRNPAARKIQSDTCTIYLMGGQEFTPLAQGNLSRDMLRRDFTINALLLSENGVLHMHPDAIEDLKNRCIRAVSPSSLADDPVRVFRAARLSAKFPDFSLHADTLAQMRALGIENFSAARGCEDLDGCGDAPPSLLYAIAPEQVGNEMRKACLAARPGNFIRSLKRGNCLVPWFTELCRAAIIPAGPPAFHDASVLEHTAHVMDGTATLADHYQATETERALAVWMALCHDIGKSETPKDMLPHHYGHEIRGCKIAEALGLRLRLPAAFVKAGKLSARLHMKAGNYRQLRPGTKADLLTCLHAAGLVAPFAWMTAADSAQEDLPLLLQNDLERLLSVTLPAQWRDKGKTSGLRLRELRCMVLSRS